MDATLAVANMVIQAGALLFVWRRVEREKDRRLVYILCGMAALVTAAGLIWRYVGTGSVELTVGLVWMLYVAAGVVVLAGIVIVLRSGGVTRFAWRQGRYAKYRQQQYRRTI